tara:strand:+ start:2040 stop:2993 length:954 start_codon:yes stop_codon:yes gene_type:complete
MKCFIPLILCVSVSHAATLDPIAARDAALQQLRTFHPETLIPGFTHAPTEVSINPNTTGDLNQLNRAASERVIRDRTARFVVAEGRRHESEAKPDITFETSKGERLLEAHEGEVVNLPCADGLCDKTVAEESNDLAEGLTELGVVSGAAEDASAHQSQAGQSSIFSGSSKQCKSLPVGLHDCCTGSGPLEWLVSCPSDMQELQRAKLEGRVVYLGSYKRHKAGHKHHVHCVFPTKLAGIIQVQGRLGQLSIPFGNPKYPNCRGLTPEELQRINFSALNLSALTTELTRRKHLPDESNLDTVNTAHVDALHQKGEAHD